MNSFWIIALGFLAQGLFFSRNLIQWFKSENEGKVHSPILFWQLSLLASLLMITYGVLRHDFAIVLGQSLVYGIYIRNLQLKKAWATLHYSLRVIAIMCPVFYWFWIIYTGSINSLLHNHKISFFWMIWGTIAQIVFVARFVFQWLYSENLKESVLPIGFWLISAAGSSMILIYALARIDFVLLIGHSFGLFTYSRNILLHFGKRGLLTNFNSSQKQNSALFKISSKIK